MSQTICGAGGLSPSRGLTNNGSIRTGYRQRLGSERLLHEQHLDAEPSAPASTLTGLDRTRSFDLVEDHRGL